MIDKKRIGRYAIRLTHLHFGWRYWAFERHTGYEDGLDPDGYGTMVEAEQAVKELITNKIDKAFQEVSK